MTAEEIKSIIQSELKSEPDLTDVRGYDLSTWFIEPKQQVYKDNVHHINTFTLWTVFEERKDGKGYYIYFDDKSKVFGLALKSDNGTMIKVGEYALSLKPAIQCEL